MNNNIIIYTTTMCPVCHMLREFLTRVNVDYKEVNVDLNPIAMIKLIGTTRRLSVPQTIINGQWIFGFDPVNILESLK